MHAQSHLLFFQNKAFKFFNYCFFKITVFSRQLHKNHNYILGKILKIYILTSANNSRVAAIRIGESDKFCNVNLQFFILFALFVFSEVRKFENLINDDALKQ